MITIISTQFPNNNNFPTVVRYENYTENLYRYAI